LFRTLLPLFVTACLQAPPSADQDGDGFDYQDDCDDQDPQSYPGAEEVFYDGVDQACDGGDDYDQDGDGFASDLHGGEDCDDERADVHPEADEVWYDGTDADCDGASDFDQDGDGHESDEHGGTDCEDQNADVFFDSGEVQRDMLDDDCDGLVDEDWIEPGDVIVCEVMADPAAVADEDGEWFEICNLTDEDMDLVNWMLVSGHGEEVKINAPLVLPAMGRLVVARNGNETENGGVQADYALGDFVFDLMESMDDIELWLDVKLIYGITWGAQWPLEEGASFSLDPLAHDSISAGSYLSWCASGSSYGDGDRGTPGDENDLCSQFDHDGDGFSIGDGDCDDEDPERHPGAVESWNGSDDDCNGLEDDLGTEVAFGYLEGGPGHYLGYPDGLSLGNFNGDQVMDLVVGGCHVDPYHPSSGGFFLVSGSADAELAGSAGDYAYGFVAGAYDDNLLGAVDPIPGDQNQDGVDDLFLGASDYYYSSQGNYAAGLFFGGNGLSGESALDDAQYLLAGSAATEIPGEVCSHLDLDADGSLELIYGDPQADQADGRGYVYVFMGPHGEEAQIGGYDLRGDCDWYISGSTAADNLGRSLGGGDVDGDGYDDLLLGAPGVANGSMRESGAVYLIYGPPGTGGSYVATLYDTRFKGAADYDRLGGLGTPQVGNFEADGAPDVVLSSAIANQAYVFLDGGAFALNEEVIDADVIIQGQGPSRFGACLLVGDYGGDGHDDLLVSAPDGLDPTASTGTWDEPGAVYLFSGASITGISGSDEATVSFHGDEAGDHFGLTLTWGDLLSGENHEVIIAAPGYGNGAGRVWVFAQD